MLCLLDVTISCYELAQQTAIITILTSCLSKVQTVPASLGCVGAGCRGIDSFEEEGSMRRIIVAGLVLSLLFAGLPLEPVRAAPILNYEFWRTWARTDLPVQSGE